MSNIQDFRNWLVENQGLGNRTAHTYYKAVKTMLGRKSPLAALKDDRAASTKHTYWAALKQWAVFIADDDLLQQLNSPAVKRLATKTGNPPRIIEPYTEPEVDAFRKTLDLLRTVPEVEPWVWPSISLMLTLGLRAQVDLCRLTWRSVEEGNRTGKLVIRTKRDKLRTLPALIVKEELDLLLAIPKWKQLSEVIAPKSTDPETLAYRRVNSQLKQIAKWAGLDPTEIRSHRFRHTAAMRLYEASGHDIHLVQQFLGHDQLQTTIGYLRLDRTAEMGALLEGMKNAH